MRIERIVSDALKRYGEQVQIHTAQGNFRVYAMVTPLRRKHRLYLDEIGTSMGVFDGSYRHYVGEAGCPLSEGDEVELGGERFSVLISERYRTGGTVVYIWAILKPVRERTDEYDNA